MKWDNKSKERLFEIAVRFDDEILKNESLDGLKEKLIKFLMNMNYPIIFYYFRFVHLI